MNYRKQKDRLFLGIRNGEHLSLREQIRLVFLLSLPSILAQLSIIVMQYIDAAMVGCLGAEASASVGLVSTTIWLFSGLNHTMSTGYYVLVAHQLGAGDDRQARQTLRESLISCLIYSLILMSIGILVSNRLPRWLGSEEVLHHDATLYFLVFSLCLPFAGLNTLCGGMLRCSGNTFLPGVLNVVMCVLDVIFNFLLIFPSRTLFGVFIPGAGLGVLGAVLGTALSYLICSLIMCYCLCVKSPELNLLQDKGSFIPGYRTLRQCIRIMFPLSMERVAMCGAQIASTIIVAPIGTIAIAANSFGIIVESLCYMPGYGIADAATALIGQSLGARRRKLAYSFGKITLSSGIAVMSIMAVIMFAFAPEVMSFMTPDIEVRALTVQCLRIEAWAEPMFAASIVAYGIFVGSGDTLRPCLMNLFSMWFVRITLATALSTRIGLRGVWMAMAMELTFRGGMFLYRFFKKSWLERFKPLTS